MNMQINVEVYGLEKKETLSAMHSGGKKKVVSNRSICQVYNDSSVVCVISSHTLIYGSLAVSNAIITHN